MKKKSTKKKSINHIKNSKSGITLIVLVITIIVLIILAGVSLSAMFGENGIINRAENAAEASKISAAKEQIELAVLASHMDKMKNNEPFDLEYIKDNIGKELGGLEIIGTHGTPIDRVYVKYDDEQFMIDEEGNVIHIGDVELNTVPDLAVIPDQVVTGVEKVVLDLTSDVELGQITKIVTPTGEITGGNGTYEITENGTYEFIVYTDQETEIKKTIVIDNIQKPGLDITGYDTGGENHQCIYKSTYDNKYHWEYCILCNGERNKLAHTLVGNGGSKTLCENGLYNNAYREVCSCGYQTGPQVVIHGRYENYASSGVLNYGHMTGIKLTDIKQITKAEFQSISYPAMPGGQEYTWEDPDGDGYGWVFCGGPITGDRGATSTIKLILGTYNDVGRKNNFDEEFKLARYIYSDSTPTLAEFVASLPAKSTLETDHLLYGMKEKYEKVTETQWNQLVIEFKGYYTHTSGWGYTAMDIQHAGHASDGYHVYRNTLCYDSSNNHNISWSDGIKTLCDLCGANATGNEAYTGTAWSNCTAGFKLQNGQTVTCTGHAVYGIGNTKLGTVYETYTKANDVTTRVRITATPESGFTYSISAQENVVLSKANYYTMIALTGTGTVTFKNTDGSITRTLSCRSYNPLADEVSPTITNITQNPQNYVDGWATINQITITGEEASSDTVYITIKNKETGDVILNNAAKLVENGVYTYTCTPLLEGAESGTVYTVTVKDRTSNPVTKEFTVQKTDSKPPELLTKIVDDGKWAKRRSVNLEATDSGIGQVSFGFNTQDDYKLGTLVDNKYTMSYNIIGDQYEAKMIAIYVKDGIGNLTTGTSVVIGKIDSTSPTITNVSQEKSGEKTKLTVEANDYNSTLTTEGSKISGYAITRSKEMPSAAIYQTSNTFNIDTAGTYYIWVKDNAGNIAERKEIVVE